MPEIAYVFQNNGNEINNDIVYPGKPFELRNHSYTFLLHPKVTFWRFGIRLSKTKDVIFHHPEKRYTGKEFDIHLGIGDWDNTSWTSPNKIELVRYYPTIDPEILAKSERYIERAEVEWNLEYNKDTNSLTISYKSGENFNKTQVEVYDYQYFKVFAWADKTPFELDCTIKSTSLNNDSGNDRNFQVGKVIFRIGDMFDQDVLQKSNVIILPASSEGTATTNIRNRAKELGIPPSVRAAAGSVLLYEVQRATNTLFAGYAFSVSGSNSNIEIIISICRKLIEILVTQKPFNEAKIEGINLPLFGTGAGALDPFEVASIFDKEFNNPKSNNLFKFFVSIQDYAVFEEIKNNFERNLSSTQIHSTIANVICDTDKGEDYLDIAKDVEAFSKVIASKAIRPPLAIALFGKWGIGKSFFINKLKASIEDITNYELNSTYCKGIVQIHLNAWSYLDANLWASIITKIFEGLNQFIKNDSKAQNVKNEIEQEFAKRLTIAKAGHELLEKQKDEVETKRKKLATIKDDLQSELDKKIKTIRDSTLSDIINKVDQKFNVKEKIESAINDNDSIRLTLEQVKDLVPEAYWDDPKKAYDQIKSKYAFVKEFFNKKGIWANLLWLLLIVSIILIVPSLLTIWINELQQINIAIPQIGLSAIALIIPIAKRIQTTYKELQPVVSEFWNIKENYQKQIRTAMFEHEQYEKALQLEIEQNKKEIELIDKQIQFTNETIIELDLKIKNFLATEALHSFIDKRSNSDEYKKYLGIVSFIRNDFEILSDLFNEHNKEATALSFREKFNIPLERIILYIDDLDRCPEERVIEVLEAVNLLMAFPLFIVVVGVDPRWIKNALIKRYQTQFTGRINELGAVDGIEKIDASNYLEKIFQIPFHIKEAADDEVKAMLKILATPPKQIFISHNSNEQNLVNELVEDFEKDKVAKNFDRTQVEMQPEMSIANLKSNKPLVNEHLRLSDKEIKLMQDLSGIIGSNPRAIKRFVNVYQIVRAHEGLTFSKNYDDSEFLVLMFLLALPSGPYNNLTRHFKNFIGDPKNIAKRLSNFLSPIYAIPNNNDQVQKTQLDIYMSDKSSFTILQQELISSFQKHNKFIQRFTFEDNV